MKRLAHLIWVYLVIRNSPRMFSFVHCTKFQCICLAHSHRGILAVQWVRSLSLCSISCMASLGSLFLSSMNCLRFAVSWSNCLIRSSSWDSSSLTLSISWVLGSSTGVVAYSTKMCGHCMHFMVIDVSMDGIFYLVKQSFDRRMRSTVG